MHTTSVKSFPLRDPMNGLTHCIGAVLAIIGTTLMIIKASAPAKPWHLVSFSVFGTSMILLYTASTLYHWLPLSERGIQRMRKVDHMMIFVLIAGTYTPICLVPLRGYWGWSLFGSVWGLAAVGFCVKLWWINAPRLLSTGIYLLMGWLCVVAAIPITRAMEPASLHWLAAGGLAYTIGALIYAFKWPNPMPKFIGFHEIFHLFVMLGTFSHFMVMYAYIANHP